jgi:hypothetical protein
VFFFYIQFPQSAIQYLVEWGKNMATTEAPRKWLLTFGFETDREIDEGTLQSRADQFVNDIQELAETNDVSFTVEHE